MQVENLTRQHGGNLVATVGTLRCAPGAVNVIPGEVQLTLDIRGPQDAPLTALLEELLGQAQAIAGRRQLRFRRRGVLSHRRHRLRQSPAGGAERGGGGGAGPFADAAERRRA